MMLYDLSRVPRPLYCRSLGVYVVSRSSDWAVAVRNLDFQVLVAEGFTEREHAAEVRDEVIKVLQAARVLANKSTPFWP